MPLVFWKVYIVGKIHLCPSLQYSLVISLKSIFFFHMAYISISWVVCYICQMEVSFCCILEPTLCMMQHKSYSRLMDVQSIPSFSHKSIFKVFNWICIIPYFLKLRNGLSLSKWCKSWRTRQTIMVKGDNCCVDFVLHCNQGSKYQIS